MTAILLFTVFGIVLVLLEVFLPGGILGIIGAGCSVAALVLCFTTEEVSSVGVWLSLVMAVCVVGITAASLYFGLKYFQRTGLGRRFVLESSIGGEAEEHSELVGQEGTVENDLRPVGKVSIAGKKFAARSERGLLRKGTAVRVVKAEGLNMIVREVETPTEEEKSEA